MRRRRHARQVRDGARCGRRRRRKGTVVFRGPNRGGSRRRVNPKQGSEPAAQARVNTRCPCLVAAATGLQTTLILGMMFINLTSGVQVRANRTASVWLCVVVLIASLSLSPKDAAHAAVTPQSPEVQKLVASALKYL